MNKRRKFLIKLVIGNWLNYHAIYGSNVLMWPSSSFFIVKMPSFYVYFSGSRLVKSWEL